MPRVGQNQIYTVNIRYFWQGNHQIYGHIQCIYTVLANPNHAKSRDRKLYAQHTATTCWRGWLHFPSRSSPLPRHRCKHTAAGTGKHWIVCVHMSTRTHTHTHTHTPKQGKQGRRCQGKEKQWLIIWREGFECLVCAPDIKHQLDYIIILFDERDLIV